MNIFLALFFLGLIQGLTEFLPVSSSGHLVLFSKIFGLEESLFLSILLHVATLLSICIVFHKDIWRMLTHPFSDESISVVVATIPTCLIVILLMPIIKQSFMGDFLPICFALSALLLFLAEMLSNGTKKSEKTQKMMKKSAFFMGIAQGFAVFPGISRSGTTISAGLLCGKDQKEVAKFSFLMSIPIILLSMVMEIYEMIVGGVEVYFPAWGIMLSFLSACLVGIFAIKVMVKLTASSNLRWFSLYLVVIAVASLFVV